jgi:hypothetical protein
MAEGWEIPSVTGSCGEGAHQVVVHVYEALIITSTRSTAKLAAPKRVMVYACSLLVALPALLGGLEALAIHPIAGVLLALSGIALSLYGAAGLCGAHVFGGDGEYR